MGIISRFPGGVGVQSDWNQNDETAPDYIKNRPFYTGDPVEAVLVEESTVSFSEGEGFYAAQIQSSFAPTVGETYKVSWDGTAYECTCGSFNNIPAIGNLSIVGLGSDTGEPFLMVVNNGQGIAIVTADTSASHTFSISGLVTEVVKIDPKYIRDMYYTGDPVETVLVEESTVSFSFSENEGVYMAQLPSTFAPTVGETYKVYWDGAAYECACVNFNDRLVIGNLSIAGEGSDTGEPFIMVVNNGRGIVIGTADTSASHTFSISGFVSEVVKIDPKYLPDTIATKSEVEVAQNTANAAQTTANAAQTTANAAQAVLDGVFSSVATFTFDKQTSGRDTFVSNAFHYYKISDFNPVPEDVISFKGTRESGGKLSEITIGSNCVKYGFFIVVAAAGNCSLPITETDQGRFTAPSAGLYAQYEEGNQNMTAGTGEFTLRVSTGSSPITDLLLKSSTTNSAKQFKITVDDSGEPTITDESDSTNTWKPTNLPTVTSSDSGKFLRVSDTGEWVAETILSASGVSF